MPSDTDIQIGELAVEEMLISEDELEEALSTLKKMEDKGKDVNLLKVLVKKGYIEKSQAKSLLSSVRKNKSKDKSKTIGSKKSQIYKGGKTTVILQDVLDGDDDDEEEFDEYDDDYKDRPKNKKQKEKVSDSSSDKGTKVLIGVLVALILVAGGIVTLILLKGDNPETNKNKNNNTRRRRTVNKNNNVVKTVKTRTPPPTIVVTTKTPKKNPEDELRAPKLIAKDDIKLSQEQRDLANSLGVEPIIDAKLGDGFTIRLVIVPFNKQPFYMSITEITQAHWTKIMKKNTSFYNKIKKTGLENEFKHTWDFPAESHLVYDAIEYCNKVSEIEGKSQYYTLTDVKRLSSGGIQSAKVEQHNNNGFRLPTPEEWEFACLGGSSGKYCFEGEDPNDLGTYAWWRGNAQTSTRPVAMKEPNGYGIFDMHGNVWEWIYVTTQETTEIRGGCYNSDAHHCKNYPDMDHKPRLSYKTVGLRIVKNVK